MSELTFIGLDVHARSVAAAVLDGSTGEVRSCAAPAHTAELVTWLRARGDSIAVAYEAGPTGFGLARACEAAHIPCLVAAPSRIARAPGERVKTDRRDALKLARLCASASWSQCACRALSKKPPVTSYAPARTRVATSCVPATVSCGCSCARASSGRARRGHRQMSAGWRASASRCAAWLLPTGRPWLPSRACVRVATPSMRRSARKPPSSPGRRRSVGLPVCVAQMLDL